MGSYIASAALRKKKQFLTLYYWQAMLAMLCLIPLWIYAGAAAYVQGCLGIIIFLIAQYICFQINFEGKQVFLARTVLNRFYYAQCIKFLLTILFFIVSIRFFSQGFLFVVLGYVLGRFFTLFSYYAVFLRTKKSFG